MALVQGAPARLFLLIPPRPHVDLGRREGGARGEWWGIARERHPELTAKLSRDPCPVGNPLTLPSPVPSASTLITALNPYHLATREPPAMAALVLGTRAVTLLPHPAAGSSREAVGHAVECSPRYLRLMEAWRWSTPLWREGVISSAADGEQVGAGVPDVYDAIRNDPSLAELRPLTRTAEALADERPDAYLDAVSSDLLRGGPDPGINIPLNAALERFAQQHRFVVVRGAANSVVQRTESRLGARAFSIGLPMLVQAGGHRLLLLRNDLRPQLLALRAAIIRSFDAGTPCPTLAPAATAYSEAFRSWSEGGLGRGDDESGRRVVSAFLAVTGSLMPADAVLRSSRAAVRSVGGYTPTQRRAAAAATGESAPPSQRTLIIRETNIAPEPG